MVDIGLVVTGFWVFCLMCFVVKHLDSIWDYLERHELSIKVVALVLTIVFLLAATTPSITTDSTWLYDAPPWGYGFGVTPQYVEPLD